MLSRSQDPLAFLAGGGEMGARTRAFDWSKTAAGPIEGWQQSLKTAVRIMLNSRYPMFVWWGRELINIYNDAYIPVLGKRHPSAFGRPAAEIWSEIWPTVGPQAEAVMNEGSATWNKEMGLIMERHGFKEEVYFSFSYSPVPNDEGGIGGVFCACFEDTPRVLSERRLRALRELAARTTEEAKSAEDACETAARCLDENLHDLPFALLYLQDHDGEPVRLAGLTGLERETPASPTTVDLRDRDAPWPFRQVVETGRAVEVVGLSDKFGPLPGGAWPESPHRAVVLPMTKPGQSRLAGFVVAGVSPRLDFNDDYKGFLDLLAGHVGTVVANARAYEEEKRRAEALADLDRAKTAFFSNVSHEFRTPLTLMLGPVEELLAKSDTDLSPGAAGQLEIVNRNGMRLLRLVNTLLDFARIEAGRVQAVYEPTDLAAFTAELASVFRSACERAGLDLVVDCPPLVEPVFVDREMWEKIVLNLISNAFKYTFEGGIAISLQQLGDAVELRIQDTGQGIPAEEMPRLFERFHRVKNAQGRTHEGSGIGLALVQELVKLHSGSVNAASVLGQGTTFTVTVPLGSDHLPPDQLGGTRSLASTATGAGPYLEEALRWLPGEGRDLDRDEVPSRYEKLAVSDPEPVPAQRDARPRVLVADDNADMRHYIAHLLSSRYRIDAVPDGEAALAAARKSPPDLVLTDVMMPRLDGFGLLRELRADLRTRSVPVIMLSARAGEESRVEGMEAGADDYLVKPFSARELLARVSAHLQVARLRQEVTEALQESRARFEALLDAAPIGVYLVDADMRIRQVNPKARPLFGDIEGLVGSDFVQIIHMLWPQAYADEIVARFRHTLETGEPYFVPEHVEERLDRKVKEYYEWQIHRLSLPDGRYGVVCYFSDISRHVLARQALADSEQALKDADRRKDEFLATLAHELRNPLAPLRNGLQIMRLASHSRESVEQARDMMERQLRHMVRLIDDLLDLSRISRGRVVLQKGRVQLSSAVQQAVETSRPLIEEMGHELTIGLPLDPIYVDADFTRLAQVFSNLLNNAAKFTERGGRISLAVERQGAEAVVIVKDNGVGIPPEMLPEVFQVFTQVDRSLERSQSGLGIGLTIVRQLVELHGGSVEARSDGHGKGSEFLIRLPVAHSPAGEQRAASESRPVEPAKRRKILVVDDNEDSATSLAMMLEIMGNETQAAFDGMEALDAAASFQPDVILLDIGMPRLNGYETAHRIRERPWGRNIALVALTGWGQEEDKRRSGEAGFNFHLVKPVDPAALTKLLARLHTPTA